MKHMQALQNYGLLYEYDYFYLRLKIDIIKHSIHDGLYPRHTLYWKTIQKLFWIFIYLYECNSGYVWMMNPFNTNLDSV